MHAWLDESAQTSEHTGTLTGMPAVAAIIDAFSDGVEEASWDDNSTDVDGNSIFGATIDGLLEMCGAAMPADSKPLALPHNPDKTADPQISLDRFPIAPIGFETLVEETPAQDMNWLHVLEAVKDSPAVAYYKSQSAQAVIVLHHGATIDGLWIGLEEEPQIGKEAMSQVAAAKDGTCTVMTVPSQVAWVLPMTWRIPVRWDTIPMDCVDPSRVCRFLADLPGSTLCIIENDTDVWTLGLRDGWVHCFWSESDRTPRSNTEELLDLWRANGAFLTIHRAMEPLQNLPMHEGVLVTTAQPLSGDITPIPLTNLIETLTGAEVAPPMFGADATDSETDESSDLGSIERTYATVNAPKSSKALTHLGQRWTQALMETLPGHAELQTIAWQLLGQLNQNTPTEDALGNLVNQITDVVTEIDPDTDVVNLDLRLRKTINEALFILDTEQEFWESEAVDQASRPTESIPEMQAPPIAEIPLYDDTTEANPALPAEPPVAIPLPELTGDEEFELPWSNLPDPLLTPALASPSLPNTAIEADSIPAFASTPPVEDTVSTTDVEQSPSMPEPALVEVDSILSRAEIPALTRNELLRALSTRQCNHATANWICVQAQSQIDGWSPDLESILRQSINRWIN